MNFGDFGTGVQMDIRSIQRKPQNVYNTSRLIRPGIYPSGGLRGGKQPQFSKKIQCLM